MLPFSWLWEISSSRMRSDRKSTRLNSSHGYISYAVFCLKKKKKKKQTRDVTGNSVYPCLIKRQSFHIWRQAYGLSSSYIVCNHSLRLFYRTYVLEASARP